MGMYTIVTERSISRDVTMGEERNRIETFRRRGLLLLIVAFVIVWMLPLFFDISSLVRYALEGSES